MAIDHKTTLLSVALENYVRMQRGDTISIPLHFSLIQDQARSGFLPMPLAPIRGGWFGLVDKVSRSVAYTHFDPTQLEDLQNNVEKLNEADSSHQWKLTGRLLIDGVPISDYKLQQEAYFMMGDNRDNSSDSRYWGMLSRANVKAKAFIIYFSFDNEDQIFSFTNPLSWVTIPLKIRWSRIGKLIHGL
jgi:signal peptidase I